MAGKWSLAVNKGLRKRLGALGLNEEQAHTWLNKTLGELASPAKQQRIAPKPKWWDGLPAKSRCVVCQMEHHDAKAVFCRSCGETLKAVSADSNGKGRVVKPNLLEDANPLKRTIKPKNAPSGGGSVVEVAPAEGPDLESLVRPNAKLRRELTWLERLVLPAHALRPAAGQSDADVPMASEPAQVMKLRASIQALEALGEQGVPEMLTSAKDELARVLEAQAASQTTVAQLTPSKALKIRTAVTTQHEAISTKLTAEVKSIEAQMVALYKRNIQVTEAIKQQEKDFADQLAKLDAAEAAIKPVAAMPQTTIAQHMSTALIQGKEESRTS